MIKTKEITLNTKGFSDVINITAHLKEFLSENKISEGIVNVFVAGSTGAVTTIEYEPNLIKDFKEAMERLAPSDIRYNHADTWNDDNGHSHIKASIVGCSESVAVSGGNLMLGTWQQVVVVDFDTGCRKRTVFLTGIF